VTIAARFARNAARAHERRLDVRCLGRTNRMIVLWIDERTTWRRQESTRQEIIKVRDPEPYGLPERGRG
jgi:hypothetical protein